MAVKKVVVAVDKKFFNNIFEKERRRMQEKIGVGNLSQANFSKMIQGFKIKQPKQDFSSLGIKKKGRRRHVRI